MGDARIVWDAKEAFLENLKYEFRYNESENALEVSYWFSSAVPDEAASIISFKPHAHTLRYGPPKHRGRNPSLDAIIEEPQNARQLLKQAENLFAQDLGGAIDRALQLLIHGTMFRCGAIDSGETPSSWPIYLREPSEKTPQKSWASSTDARHVLEMPRGRGVAQNGLGATRHKKERSGGSVKSVYVGRGEVAHMISKLQSSSALIERFARTMRSSEQVKLEKAEAALEQASELIQLTTQAALLTTGFHTHKRQWRRMRNADRS